MSISRLLSLVAAAAVAAGAACAGRAPAPGPGPAGEESGTDLTIRVGLETGLDSAFASAPGGVLLRPGRRGEPAAGSSSRVSPRWTFELTRGGIVAIDTAGRRSGPSGRFLLRTAAGTGLLELQGRPYRGAGELLHVAGHGIVVVNVVGLEDYLLGVVPVEIGPRSEEEIEAVKAQAVAARTYAVRNVGRRDSLGFDVFGTVEDQVYGGVLVERGDATRAVRSTAGEVVTYRGRPIRAYYHSTGGGRTAAVGEVWHLPDAPYLRSVSDRRPGGGYYCEASPRFRWTARWTGAELRTAVERGLAAYYGVPDLEVGEVREVRVLKRTETGRVRALEVRTEGGRHVLWKNDIRFVLRTPDGGILGSTDFALAPVRGSRRDPGSVALRAEGRGFGHGIGMCQWGAIGRARAGQDYREILRAYYPGTDLREVE